MSNSSLSRAGSTVFLHEHKSTIRMSEQNVPITFFVFIIQGSLIKNEAGVYPFKLKVNSPLTTSTGSPFSVPRKSTG